MFNIFLIPPKSPGVNAIENIFNRAKENLYADAFSGNITFKDFDKILKSVKEALLSILLQTMSKGTVTMPKILVMIAKDKGKL